MGRTVSPNDYSQVVKDMAQSISVVQDPTETTTPATSTIEPETTTTTEASTTTTTTEGTTAATTTQTTEGPSREERNTLDSAKSYLNL